MAMRFFLGKLCIILKYLFFNFSFQSGEYFVSLKGFKIPHKSAEINNPPPPGTEDDDALNKLCKNFESPLATDKRPTPPTFENPFQNAPLPHSPKISSELKPTKRSALFSKFALFYVSSSCVFVEIV